MVSHHIRAMHRAVKTKVKAKLPTKERIAHIAKIGIRVSILVALIHLGITGLIHWGIFLKFGKTSEFVTGSVVDYLLVGSWEGS